MHNLVIRHCGSDRPIPTVSHLKEILDTEYRGESLSIIYTSKPHGLSRVIYCDVQDSGVVVESYGSGKKVDLKGVESDLMVIS